MPSRSRQPRHSARPRALRPDQNGFERGHVVEMQRARLLAAAGQVACERGVANVAVAQIVGRAGVSRRTFYEIFDDRDDCLLAAMQAALERARARVLPAWRSPGAWRERVRRSLVELLGLFDEEPVLARLLMVESLVAGRGVFERRSRVLGELIEAVDEGRREARPGAHPAQLSAEGAVGGVLAVLHARIERAGPGRMIELTGQLMSMLVLPYLGAAAARRELERPLPVREDPRESDPPLASDPFKDAGMRLTYRTMRVLSSIAEHPGSSNRKLGNLAEVGDQGQISKLLARLERLGLVANEGKGHAQGEPNAWTLTAKGRQVAQNVHAHSESFT